MPPRQVTRELVDRPACTAAESLAIEQDFQRRLESIAVFCESIGTLPIFVIPPCNDADWDPSRSVLAAGTLPAERATFSMEVTQARSVEAKDRSAAVGIYRDLVQRHPEFAETHYRLARLLEQTGSWSEAKEHFVQARELDGMPMRCPERLRQAYRLVARRHPSILLVDGPEVLEAKSRHGITDDRLFHDAQHPNLEGYVALAENLLLQLRARRAFGWPAEKAVPAFDARCLCPPFRFERSAVGGSLQARSSVLPIDGLYPVRSQVPERAGGGVPSSRRGNQRRTSPADAGIPGWPLPPPPAKSHRIAGRPSREP